MPGRHAALHDRRRRRRSPWRFATVVLACALVVVALVAARALLDTSAAADDCTGEAPVDLVVAPEMSAVMEVAAEKIGDVDVDGRCAALAVTAQPAAKLLHAVEDGSAELPDLWVPAASTWLSQLPQDAAPDGSEVRRFARTPVVLVGHEGPEQPVHWLGALGQPDSTMPDPRESSAAVGAIAALHAESVAGATNGSDLAGWIVASAQRSGGADDLTEDALYDGAAEASAGQPAFFPSTEQRFVHRAEEQGDAPLTALVPESGAPMLDYPLAALGGERVRGVFAALGDHLASASGQKALAEAGFRPPSGQAPEGAAGVGDVSELGSVTASGIDRLLRQWVTLSVRTRMLAVIDVSGSMGESAGDKTRMQLAIDAAVASLELMPDDAELGIWAFSIGLDEEGRDFREVVPVKELGGSGDAGHRAAVVSGARGLGSIVGGGTGLYDTTLAAFRTAQANFDPARSNSVVVLTDGENEDPEGLSLRQLTDAIKSEQDAATPVQIVTIGMGPEADTQALQRISALTDARTYVAEDPRDIAQIFTDALLERVGWGLR